MTMMVVRLATVTQVAPSTITVMSSQANAGTYSWALKVTWFGSWLRKEKEVLNKVWVYISDW